MSYTKLQTYTKKPITEEKSYLKDTPNDNAFGLLKQSAFLSTAEAEHKKCFLLHSYENEIHFFVKRLLKGISAVTDDDGEIEHYLFEDSERFDEKHLLWACFDLLIKADLTIEIIKRERMHLLGEVIKHQSS